MGFGLLGSFLYINIYNIEIFMNSKAYAQSVIEQSECLILLTLDWNLLNPLDPPLLISLQDKKVIWLVHGTPSKIDL